MATKAKRSGGYVLNRGYAIPEKVFDYAFPKNVNLFSEGRLKERFLPLGMQNGKQYSRFRYDPDNLRKRSGSRWKSSPGSNSGVLTIRQLQIHFKIAAYAVERNGHNFAHVLAERALKIFQDSFKYQKFHSRDAESWPDLKEWTIKKRIKHNTLGSGKKLFELGELYKSLNFEKTKLGGRVYTDPKAFKKEVYPDGSKRRAFCYAAIHNEGPEGGYSFGRHKAVRRQFIGHSTYIFDFARSIARKYLFDDVFLTK